MPRSILLSLLLLALAGTLLLRSVTAGRALETQARLAPAPALPAGTVELLEPAARGLAAASRRRFPTTSRRRDLICIS
jgi:hypothetical protein